MDNRIVYRAAKAAAVVGFAALRFNFRGVGKSSGQYDQGLGEREDVSAALRWMKNRYPELPLAVIGYSFGAWVGLQVGCADSGVIAMAGIAPPLNLYAMEYLVQNSKPSMLVVGTQDEFCSQESMMRLKSRLPATSSVHIVEGADHFFSEQTDRVENLISDFFNSLQLGYPIS
jgi:alpha/beta superfamily hydrolase